jgi:hypothetical protein
MKAGEKKLNYEMNPYVWKELEPSNGKKKVVILDDKNEDKDWGKEDNDLLKPLP